MHVPTWGCACSSHLLTGHVSTNTGALTLAWVVLIGGSSVDQGNGVALDPANAYVYVAGTTRSSTLGGGTAINGAVEDAFLAKCVKMLQTSCFQGCPVQSSRNCHGRKLTACDPPPRLDASNGNRVWTKMFGSSTVDNGYAVAATSSAVFVAGQATGTMTVGSLTSSAPQGTSDGFVLVLSRSAAGRWT
jgi:hypothetical protein